MAQFGKPAWLGGGKQGVDIRSGALHLRDKSFGRDPARPRLAGLLYDVFGQFFSMARGVFGASLPAILRNITTA